MPDTTAMATVSFHYWAGARAAAGTELESVAAGTLGQAIEEICARRTDPHFARVVRASTLLVNGTAARSDSFGDPLPASVTVEVLPPFAGG